LFSSSYNYRASELLAHHVSWEDPKMTSYFFGECSELYIKDIARAQYAHNHHMMMHMEQQLMESVKREIYVYAGLLSLVDSLSHVCKNIRKLFNFIYFEN
jgi:hypothetical protein